MSLAMVDSIESPATTGQPIPRLVLGEPVVAGYIAGNSWPTYFAYAKARPDLVAADRVISITLTARAVARCLDIESGGATVDQAPGWWRLAQPHYKTPVWFYTSASNAESLVQAMSSAGIPRDRYYLWIADYDFVASTDIPARWGVKSDGKQYSDKGAENCDLSLISDYMVGPPPPPPDPNHYLYFDAKKRAVYGGRTERDVVEEYDKLRAEQTPHKHPSRARLAVLRAQCHVGAARIWVVAHRNPRRPRWDLYHRGWRWQQLRRRWRGQRVA